MVRKQKIVFFFIFLAIGLFEYLCHSPYQALGLALMSFLMMHVVRFELLHPYVWFGGFYTIYAIGYPLLYWIGVDISRGYSYQPLFYAWLGLLIFYIIVTDKINGHSVKKEDYDCGVLSEKAINIMIIISLLSIWWISRSGMMSKSEIYSSNNLLLNISFSLMYLLIVFYVVNFLHKKKMDKVLMLKVGISCILISLFSGERDIMFQFLFITVLMLYFNNYIKKRHYILLAPVGVGLIIFSKIFKYYFLSGLKSENVFRWNVVGIISALLSGEFESASRNLQLLVNNADMVKGIMFGKTYISDITRIFGYAPYSCIEWYKKTFFNNYNVGQGFTLLGEGYINFGTFGIILEMMIVAIFCNILYKKSRTNYMYLAMYLCSIPILIYANRADLANVFSPFCRHILLSVFILKIISDISKVKGKKVYRKE